MLKNEFKSIKSQYRSEIRKAYQSAMRSSCSFSEQAAEYSKLALELNKSFECNFGINFSSLSKPDKRVSIVSLKVFSALGYQFDKIKEPRFN